MLPDGHPVPPASPLLASAPGSQKSLLPQPCCQSRTAYPIPSPSQHDLHPHLPPEGWQSGLYSAPVSQGLALGQPLCLGPGRAGSQRDNPGLPPGREAGEQVPTWSSRTCFSSSTEPGFSSFWRVSSSNLCTVPCISPANATPPISIRAKGSTVTGLGPGGEGGWKPPQFSQLQMERVAPPHLLTSMRPLVRHSQDLTPHPWGP